MAKWTSGAGARIGCVRDYPAELQSKALEQVNLSPNKAPAMLVSFPSPRPSPKIRMSPRVQHYIMGGQHHLPIRTPTLQLRLTLPNNKNTTT